MEKIKKKKKGKKKKKERPRQPVQRGLYCARVREEDVGCSRSSATVAGRTDGCPDNGDGEGYKKLRLLSDFEANESLVTKTD